MADAMDWQPTTPPPTHNPYSHLQYMPGGWPESPPPWRCTADIFARKREAGLIECATKRVCAGVKTIGTIAALPVKPLYIIVRHLRSRERQKPHHRGRRSAAQSRRKSAGTRAGIAAAELNLFAQETITTSQQTATPPPTPPATPLRTPLVAQERESIQHSAATSVTSATNTETPFSTTNINPYVFRGVTRGYVNRNTTEIPAGENFPDISLRYSTLSGYLAAQSSGQRHTPLPVQSSPIKKMKKVNHFELQHKRSPTAYVTRGLTRRPKLKSIGTKLDEQSKTDSIWGTWEHEKPLSLRYQEPTPDGQLQSELEFHVSELSESSVDLEADQSESIPKPPANSADPIIPPPPATLLPLDDERWSCSHLLEQFLPDTIAKQGEAGIERDQPEPANPAPAFSNNISTSVVGRLFHDTKSGNTPPPIRRRVFKPTVKLRSAKSQGSDITSVDDEKFNISTSKQDDVSTVIRNGTEAQLHDEEVSGVLPCAVENAADTGSGAETTTNNNNIALVPITPMKVVAEISAKEATEASIGSATNNIFETPAQKFSKLSIKGHEDNDTPKATPHSGTKTTRVTRYREALEKAQKAKLQQYELVPITNEWDQKVRAAIRHGIPNYLGAHDLARVVPQYAQRGQDNWLNDETINKYLDLVAAHGRKNDRPDQVKSHHAFNNFFYNNLKQKGARSVLSWSKRAKIGGKNLAYVEKVFVPINSGAHWTLAVVEPTQKKITHYNSMRGSATGTRACEDLKDWVALEMGKDFKEEEWTLTAVGESPQQTNSDDCGVFTITSARQIMLGYTPMSYGPAQIPLQRVRIVAELINQALLKSTGEE